MTKRLAVILAVALLGVLAISSVAGATEAFEDPPGTTVSVESTEPLPVAMGATPIAPDPTVADPRPHAWDRIVVRSDGRTLDVYFWMGIEECNGLHSVTVAPTTTGIDVGLMSGTPADMAPDTACIEIAQLYVTTVTLDQALISNSA